MPTLRVPTRRLAALCTIVFAASCASTLDAGGLEAQLSSELHDRFPDSAWQVSCPDGIEPKAGSTFTCTATDDGGDSIEVEITQDDGEGRVTWRLAGVGG